MRLVAYRDMGDDYVTRTFDLTTDIQDLYANLLELKARGGGDWPESVNEALDVANELDKQMKQRIEPETLSTGCTARQVRRRAARQGAAEGVVLRSRRRGYVEGADQAVSCRVVG